MKKRRVLSFLIALLVLAIGVVAIALVEIRSPHPCDSVLARNLFDHEHSFNQLVNMATGDSTVDAVGTSYACLKNPGGWPPYIYLHEDQPWPSRPVELGFSQGRWDTYRSLFRELSLKGVKRHEDMPDALFFTASVDSSEIDETETVITEKGYVYSRKELNTSLKGSLEGLEINRPAIFYRKLNRDWYLYYEWSVAKPE